MTRRATALPFLGLYVLLALTFFALMRDHAFHPTDDGFVLAYSWRIAQGELPYRDFLYVRTPLSPYLHVAWLALPDGWQIPAGRLAFYVEMAAAAFFPTAWAVGRGMRATLPALASTGAAFLLSLHNFPPMPWPTVDAVFFGSAGATAFLIWCDRRHGRWLVASTALITLASLAKQSFAPLSALVVVAALLIAWRTRDRRAALAALVPPALIAGGVAAILVANGALADAVQQILAPSRIPPSPDDPWSGDLFALTARPWVEALSPVLIALVAVLAYVFSGREDDRRSAYATPLAVALPALGAAVLLFDTNTAGIVVFLGIVAIGLGAAGRAMRRVITPPVHAGTRTSGALAFVVLLVLGWCASLSFAYQTPLLALGALGPMVVLALPRTPRRADAYAAAVALAAVTVVVTLLNVDHPYRDRPRDLETADLGEIYPRLGHLYTNTVNAARHRELRDMTERFALQPGRPFVVLTAFPLAHYLTGTRNPLSLDWLERQEYAGSEERLRREMLASAPVVLIQRQVGEAVAEGPPALSCAEALAAAPGFAADALARDALVQEGTFFCVYAPR